ncbi:single-stranded-DNA-specific exonuclease RecJ [Aliiglaciecola sp. M165]|uniref:single-stranded-DNA-specific exonuclease RecJ n=1 Tax=Aliiglaciecola sp. M165 TaxID=2593649 RepID=UPI00117D97B6|nr:single-stranded-DNA-specific exonuclease RecJ [Aliiglaciecola sp. M165]TRY30605.1 single-stranded-DNA-specific exonuclease RecJ [Aliiglaciecola sp. M165]
MPTAIKRRAPVDDSHLSDISHPVIRQIYANRGVDSTTQLDKRVNALLHYQQLQGIDGAVQVFADAIANKQKIIIVGDFDADGATSTALSILSLRRMGAENIEYLVPNRFDFGYGLSPQIVDVAHQQGAQVIMTVDNGIACIEGVDRAKQHNMRVVVTDHHLAADQLPNADAIVNPNQPGCDFLSKHLAGVGVAFYVMLALRSHLKSKNWFEKTAIVEPNLAEYLDIVALGTVADVVPLDENNRILVHQGLQRIRSGRCRPGITALIDIAGRNASTMVASDLGFVLGPRLNAAGRLDDMSLGIECLLCDDPRDARKMALQLDNLNKERREIQESMQQEALSSLQSIEHSDLESRAGIVLYKQDYHQGVVGILAGKIKDKYNRPTIAFAHQTDSLLKGSARSIQGIHIRDLLEDINNQFPQVIDKFGGHAMAAGVTLKLEQLEAFQRAFAHVSQKWLEAHDLTDNVMTDGELQDVDFSIDFAQQLKNAGPWGQGFPEPIFDGEFRIHEQKLLSGKHLKLLLSSSDGQLIDGIAFNVDTQSLPSERAERVKLAYKLDINVFRGRTNLQLMIEALEPL